MKYAALIIGLFLCSCDSESSKNTEQRTVNDTTSINEKTYVKLGGEMQYVEITSKSEDNPILLVIHGGPAWPQTPQWRHYNSEISQKYTVVLWEQRGAGHNYKRNPNPPNLSLKQLVKDAHELTEYLKTKYQKDKIFVAGYSWGSLIGIDLVKQYPNDYLAYIGIAQIVNMNKGMKISQKWLSEQALKAKDENALVSLDSLKVATNYTDDLDRFFNQWVLLNKYRGALYNAESEKETEMAMVKYSDYKDYNWFKVWQHSAKAMQNDMFGANLDSTKNIEVPLFLIQGRHDWNIPSVLAEEWFNNLEAPHKKMYWFENSGHGPLEEEPQKFNNVVMGILGEMDGIK